MNQATIAVITYKRPLWLNRLLVELKKQNFTGFRINIVVVDNACDDETEKIVKFLAINSPIEITYAVEEKIGIVAARNKCIEIFLNSKSNYLIFIDDDEWPTRNDWALTMLEKKIKYSADIVTSHVLSIGEPGTPDWAVNLIYGKNSFKDGDVVKIFYTNNLLLSRNVIEKIKPAFDLRFAKTGASDYHFALKCINHGFRAVYVDSPVNEEFPKTRATISWFIKRGFRSGVGFTRAHLYEDRLLVALWKSSFMSVIRFARGLISLLVGCFFIDKQKIVNGVFRLSSAVGTIVGLFGVKYNEYNTIHGK